MQPTAPQVSFLTDLRRGARRATAAMDASMVGPLIRANLVQWDDDPADAAKRHRPPASIFTLTRLGARFLEDFEAARRFAPG